MRYDDYDDDGYDGNGGYDGVPGVEAGECTKTDAKKLYKLNDGDLARLPVRKEVNPMSPAYAPMCLYKTADLERAAAEKFKTDGGLAGHLQKKADATRAREGEKKRLERNRAALVAALQAAGVRAGPAMDAALGDKLAKQFIKKGASEGVTAAGVAGALAPLAAAGALGAAATPAKATPAQSAQSEAKQRGGAAKPKAARAIVLD